MRRKKFREKLIMTLSYVFTVTKTLSYVFTLATILSTTTITGSGDTHTSLEYGYFEKESDYYSENQYGFIIDHYHDASVSMIFYEFQRTSISLAESKGIYQFWYTKEKIQEYDGFFHMSTENSFLVYIKRDMHYETGLNRISDFINRFTQLISFGYSIIKRIPFRKKRKSATQDKQCP